MTFVLRIPEVSYIMDSDGEGWFIEAYLNTSTATHFGDLCEPVRSGGGGESISYSG